MKRYALIYARANQVEPYLPDNYSVAGETLTPSVPTGRWATVIEGRDNAGWTLDDYVLPRLASGLYFGEEIDLSHPALKAIPEVS